jgi:hypothetical protein
VSLCMHPRCHLMREHTPDECGWPPAGSGAPAPTRGALPVAEDHDDYLGMDNPQDALIHPVHQVYFRAGLLACREYMARFVEATEPAIAMSIRANWWPMLGNDFGPPRQLLFDEVAETDAAARRLRPRTADELTPTQEALPIALGFLQAQQPPRGETPAPVVPKDDPPPIIDEAVTLCLLPLDDAFCARPNGHDGACGYPGRPAPVAGGVEALADAWIAKSIDVSDIIGPGETAEEALKRGLRFCAAELRAALARLQEAGYVEALRQAFLDGVDVCAGFSTQPPTMSERLKWADDWLARLQKAGR